MWGGVWGKDLFDTKAVLLIGLPLSFKSAFPVDYFSNPLKCLPIGKVLTYSLMCHANLPDLLLVLLLSGGVGGERERYPYK